MHSGGFFHSSNITRSFPLLEMYGNEHFCDRSNTSTRLMASNASVCVECWLIKYHIKPRRYRANEKLVSQTTHNLIVFIVGKMRIEVRSISTGKH